MDWNNDEEVVKGKWPDAHFTGARVYRISGLAYTSTHILDRETNGLGANWKEARQDESVVAFERTHRVTEGEQEGTLGNQENAPICGEEGLAGGEVWVCTEQPNHEHHHRALDIYSNVRAIWPKTAAVSASPIPAVPQPSTELLKRAVGMLEALRYNQALHHYTREKIDAFLAEFDRIKEEANRG